MSVRAILVLTVATSFPLPLRNKANRMKINLQQHTQITKIWGASTFSPSTFNFPEARPLARRNSSLFVNRPSGSEANSLARAPALSPTPACSSRRETSIIVSLLRTGMEMLGLAVLGVVVVRLSAVGICLVPAIWKCSWAAVVTAEEETSSSDQTVLFPYKYGNNHRKTKKEKRKKVFSRAKLIQHTRKRPNPLR